MPYGDLFTSLARYYGAGQQRGIAEEEAIQGQIRGFQRLAPLREMARAEEVQAAQGAKARELDVTYGPGTGAKYLAGTFAGVEPTKLAREAEERGAAVEAVAPTLRARGVFPSTPEPGRELYEVEPSPPAWATKVKPDVLHWLLTETKPAKPDTSITHVDMQRAYANPADPRHAEAVLYFEGPPGKPETGYIDVQKRVAGARAAGPLPLPPVATQAQMDDLNLSQVLLSQLDVVEKGYTKNKHLLGGLGTGAGRMRRQARQFFGTLAPAEQDWLAAAESLRGQEILDFFGKVVPKGEQNLAARMIPDVDAMQPDQFKAAIKATRNRILEAQGNLQRQLRTGRGEQGGSPQPRPVGLPPEYSER